MVYTRKVKRGNKIYLYKYKSQRVGGKVKSIYVGKEEVGKTSVSKTNTKRKAQKKSNKPEIKKKAAKKTTRKTAKKQAKSTVKKVKNDLPSLLMEFNHLIVQINDFLNNKQIEEASKTYKELVRTYNQLLKHVDTEDKFQLYHKVKEVYDMIVIDAETIGYDIKE